MGQSERRGETLVRELAHFGAHWPAHGVRARRLYARTVVTCRQLAPDSRR